MKYPLQIGLHASVWGLFFIILLSACDKGESFPVESGNGALINRTLTLTTYHLYLSNAGVTDSLLPSVTIELYADSFDRESRQNPIKYGQTDEDALLKFEYLPTGFYYLFAEHAEMEGTVQLDINIPQASVNAYEDIWITTK